MTEQTENRFVPDIVVLTKARLSFPRLTELRHPTDNTGKPRPNSKPKVDCTLLLDPSNVEHQKQIATIKQAAFKACLAKWGGKENFPKADPRTGMGGLIFCYGNGNDLKKVYDGYKDMFFIKCSNTQLPIIGDRRGNHVQLVNGAWHVLDPNNGSVTEEIIPAAQVPYGGAYVRARISPYVYFASAKNPNSANGVNFNIRSVQFMEPGPAFGGGAPLSARDELEKMAGDAVPAAAASDDPWG